MTDDDIKDLVDEVFVKQDTDKESDMPEYRFDHSTNTVYRWSEDQDAYMYFGRLNGQSEAQFKAYYADWDLFMDSPYEDYREFRKALGLWTR